MRRWSFSLACLLAAVAVRAQVPVPAADTLSREPAAPLRSAVSGPGPSAEPAVRSGATPPAGEAAVRFAAESRPEPEGAPVQHPDSASVLLPDGVPVQLSDSASVLLLDSASVLLLDSASVLFPDGVPVQLPDSVPALLSDTASAPASLSDSAEHPSRDRRVHRSRKSWARLIPTQAKLQYAGSIGVVSVGFGWDYGRRGQWETDIQIGVVPAYNTGTPKATFSLKESCVPWSIACSQRVAVEPFACGAWVTAITGNDFWARQPSRYPKGWWSVESRIRLHIFVGSRVTFDTGRRPDRLIRKVSAYYELSTMDLYLISRVTNATLGTWDILSLSLGLKFQLF